MDDYSLSNQSTTTIIAVILIGTASMLPYVNQPSTEKLVPKRSYSRKFEQQSICYSLENETMPTDFINIDAEPLVNMPIIRKIRVKFNHPTQLEFVSVEDNKGFIK